MENHGDKMSLHKQIEESLKANRCHVTGSCLVCPIGMKAGMKHIDCRTIMKEYAAECVDKKLKEEVAEDEVS